MIEVSLMSRRNCPLCDEMKAAVERAADGLDVAIAVVDVDSDAKLADRYGSDVPVLLVDGVEAFRHRATEAELRARLRLE